MKKLTSAVGIWIALNSACVGVAAAAGAQPTQFASVDLPAKISKAAIIGCEHSNANDHKLFCVKNKSACFDKNRSFRPHEMVHCKIQYDQCMRVWD